MGPDNLIGNILRHIVSFDESTKTVEPDAEVSVFGVGGRIHGGSCSRTVRYDAEDFPFLFQRMCEREQPRLFLSIDEIQKVPLDELSIVCNVFQMASRKGYDVLLAVAGLPFAYKTAIQHDGCTYLRRGEHEELGPFLPAEVRDAFSSVLERIDGLTIEPGALDRLVDTSKGHPYLMQLEGYCLIDAINDKTGQRRYHVSESDVASIIPRALDAYSRHATRPLLDAMPSLEIEYLRAMARVMDDNRVARTADIAQELGKRQNQTSRARDYLISNGILYSPGRGELVFAIPYLADYLLEHDDSGCRGLEAVRQWRM